jgi:hypothetical protein
LHAIAFKIFEAAGMWYCHLQNRRESAKPPVAIVFTEIAWVIGLLNPSLSHPSSINEFCPRLAGIWNRRRNYPVAVWDVWTL